MAYPSLSELLAAYNVGGPGKTIEAGTQGLMQGTQLASNIANKQAMDEYRKQQFAERVKEFQTKTGLEERKVGVMEEKAKPKTYSPEQIGGLKRLAEGKAAPEELKTLFPQGIDESLTKSVLGSSMKDIMTPLAKSRLAVSAVSNFDKDTDISRNKQIIERCIRLEKLGDAEHIVQDTGALVLLQEGIEAQVRGGVSSALGLEKLQNETIPQFTSRLLAKVKNAPQEAGTKAFVDQIKAISKQETKAAIQGLQGTVAGKAGASADVYDSFGVPGGSEIKKAGNEYVKTYLSHTLGKKISDELTTENIDKLVETEPTDTVSVGTAADWLKKHGVSGVTR